MKKQNLMLATVVLGTSLLFGSTGVSAAEPKKDELAFAVCDEYINIRAAKDTDSTVVAKLYNHSAVTVLEVYDDGWCLVISGDAVGYMKSKRLVAGQEAYPIAEEVAYNVAVVYPDALNVRAKANDDSNIIDVAKKNDQLEVVQYDGGAWMKVCMAADSYGYIDASQCEMKTYYPVAVMEDEAASKAVLDSYVPSPRDEKKEEAVAATEVPATEVVEVAAEAPAEEIYEENTAEPSYEEETTGDAGQENSNTDDSYTDDSYTDDSHTNDSYTDDSYTDDSYTETPAENQDQKAEQDDSATVVEPDDTYTTEEEDPYPDQNEEAVDLDGPSDGDDSSFDQPYYDADSQTEMNGSEGYTQSSSGNGSAGQAIADYALQFVGNPYVYGGTSLTNGTDCSGFTQSVMANFGIDIARVAADQSYGGTSVSNDDLQAGDLLFYSDGGDISHVAMYIGDGQIVHASTEETGIIVSDYDYSNPVAAQRYW